VTVTVVEEGVPLTSLCSAGGCAAKLGAADLHAVLDDLGDLAVGDDDRLTVGVVERDDAAVFRLDATTALVQTVDFLTPPVDDPYDFGRIAAANALSDVYAMGAQPLTAMNIVGFPLRQLGRTAFGEVLRGGADVVRAAGAVVVGGHSIRDAEPKYGLAVTGIARASAVVRVAGAEDGDVLMLTKPLGSGAIVTARKRGRAGALAVERAVETMVTLNDSAARLALRADVHAMTDVTGFGLLGHLHNLCRASGLAAEVDAGAIPVLDEAVEPLESEGGVSSGTVRNLEWARRFASFADVVEPWRRWLLADATTSGGLLMAVPRDRVADAPGLAIGHVRSGTAGEIVVR
jgi:selenide, water dikinase